MSSLGRTALVWQVGQFVSVGSVRQNLDLFTGEVRIGEPGLRADGLQNREESNPETAPGKSLALAVRASSPVVCIPRRTQDSILAERAAD